MSGTRAACRALAATVLAVVVVASASGAVRAADPLDVGVELNGEPLALDPPAFVFEGLAYVPLRGFVEQLGGTVDYDPATRQITVSRGSSSVVLPLDSPEAVVNGQAQALAAPPLVVNGRTFIPARFVVEALGDRVDWIAHRSTLAVWSVFAYDPAAAGMEGYEARTPVIPYTEEELDLLTRVINAEAYDEPYEGMVAVGAVVVNRVLSPNWPDTIHDVIMQPGQFAVVSNGHINRDVRPEARLAALDALHGVDPTSGALFFFNPNKTGKTPGSQILVTIGNHAFSR